MGRNLEPKCKQCRRAKIKLFLKGELCSSPKCPMVKRNYPPGMHGISSRSRLTGYGEQLAEKQKAKKVYGILERQFKKYYTLAVRQSGNASEKLVQLLEMRLDNVVYRLGFTVSRSQARQMVTHGLFIVNDRKVNIPSYQVKIGDHIALREKSKKLKLFSNIGERLSGHQPPSWLSVNHQNLSGKILDRPKREETENLFDPTTIIEFYSK